MKRLFAVAFCTAALVLSGCDKNNAPSAPTSNSAADAKVALIKDISGVWNPSDSSGLWTLNYSDNRLQTIFGDTFMPVTVGDIDTTNETVNLKVTIPGGGEKIMTIRKVWNSDHTSYNLAATMWDGSQVSLSFVRKIQTDDLNRIAQLAAQSGQGANTQSGSAMASAESQTAAKQPQSATTNTTQATANPAADAASQVATADSVVPMASAAAMVGSNPNGAAAQADNASGQTYQTSFDCAQAHTLTEYLICHDPDLAASDRELGGIYQQAKAAVTDKAAFAERARKQWNYREKNCRDKPCLAAWYAYQKGVLTKIAQTGDVNAQ
ncbi:lysozyme inhibitor LprI family protein [Burkholderia guangdongensis]|uniref:lysozyme inhibitor LprI family protein n=1 Tax=Burkholderia guangdongensis TaxID=1792500 RepID=UPI001FE776CC|nr:hypothetical protein [Burkholderia guangdongensis]